MKEIKNILNYWYNLELVIPYWPSITKETKQTNKRNINIINFEQWLNNDKSNTNFTYDIYMGKINIRELIEKMMKSIGDKYETIDNSNENACLCAFKLNKEGIYVKESFKISTFIVAVSKIINEKNINIKLDEKEIKKINKKMNNIMITYNNPLIPDDFIEIYEISCKKANITIKEEFHIVINKTKAKKEKNKKNKFEIEDTETEMLESFYLTDITTIKNSVNTNKISKKDKIIKYIDSLNNPVTEKIEIDKDINEMKKWLTPDNYPLGKWPSKHNPSLMQQIAINISITDHNSIFSINGPPGTGKTTLIKEIIASNIVERAIKLSQYEYPDDAFIKNAFKYSEKAHLQYYYSLNNDLKKYGIIVASNNNAAVENISKDLPLFKSVSNSHTDYFKTKNKDIYFTKMSNTLNSMITNKDKNEYKDCWGAISACLGKRVNINNLMTSLWFDAENYRDYYKKETPNWEIAKKEFINKYNQVLNYRKEINQDINNIIQQPKIKKDLETSKNKINELNIKIEETKKQYSKMENNKKETEHQLKTENNNKKLIKNELPFYKIWFLSIIKLIDKSPLIIEIIEIENKISEITIELTQANTKINKLEKEFNKAKSELLKEIERCGNIEKKYINNKILIDKYKNKYGNNYADDKFWLDIQNNEISQISCPWTNPEYDKLREELFYYSLQLQKAFVLNTGYIKTNMNCLIDIWKNNFSKRDKKSSYAALLNTLFLIIPVISTTFASVSSFLSDIDKDELGTLIVDEAGQATPYSALGALWRTEKAIIIGDPLQIEPIITVPKELSRKFIEEFKINKYYSDYDLSVQILADNINPYGGYRRYSDYKLWLGCPLNIHRRCIEPMFTISNKIAYNNKMHKKSLNPSSKEYLLLKKSTWMNIVGQETEGSHYIQEQGKMVIQMINKAITTQKQLPDIYIISPFKTIAYTLRTIIKNTIKNNFKNIIKEKEIDEWVNRSIGTIHTFQGKEAKEVILVLGCEKGKSDNAAYWAGKKPNILNVAMTRAKYRIVIIGDTELWRKIPYFNQAYSMIKN